MNKILFHNSAVKIYSIFLNVLAVPLYISYMGIEAYGLVGVFLTIQLIAIHLDMGLPLSVVRQIATLRQKEEAKTSVTDLIYNIFVFYTVLALALGLAFYGVRDLLSTSWITTQNLSQDAVNDSLGLMAIALVFIFPTNILSNILIGLEKQSYNNLILFAISNIRILGSIGSLILFPEQALIAFFIWQLVTAVLYFLILSLTLNHIVSFISSAKRFSLKTIRVQFIKAFDFSVISLCGLAITQIDKVVLSKYLTLEAFGYYTIAVQVAFTMQAFGSAAYQAYFPKFSQLANEQKTDPHLYRTATQFLAMVSVLPCFIIMIFSQEILYLYTQSVDVVANSAYLCSLLILGMYINLQTTLPAIVGLSGRFSRHYAKFLLALSLCYGVGMISAVQEWGAIGAALAWISANICILCLSIYIIITYYRPVFIRWLSYDLLLPALFFSFLLGGIRLLQPWDANYWSNFLTLTVATLACLISIPLIFPMSRTWIKALFWKTS